MGVLHDTIKDVEKDYPYFKVFEALDKSDAVSKSAIELAKNLDKEALVPFTMSGMSAQTLSKYRPKQSIYAVTHSIETHRQLNIVWGVRPLFVMERVKNPTRLIYNFIQKIIEQESKSIDKRYIITMGSTIGKEGSTNLIRLLNREVMGGYIKRQSF